MTAADDFNLAQFEQAVFGGRHERAAGQLLELLRALRASGPSSIRALSIALARDYKSVHTDGGLLADAGLIKRNKDGSISAPWDKVQAELRLAS